MVPRPRFWRGLAAPVLGPSLLPCRLRHISSGWMLQWMRRRSHDSVLILINMDETAILRHVSGLRGTVGTFRGMSATYMFFVARYGRNCHFEACQLFGEVASFGCWTFAVGCCPCCGSEYKWLGKHGPLCFAAALWKAALPGCSIPHTSAWDVSMETMIFLYARIFLQHADVHPKRTDDSWPLKVLLWQPSSLCVSCFVLVHIAAACRI